MTKPLNTKLVKCIVCRREYLKATRHQTTNRKTTVRDFRSNTCANKKCVSIYQRVANMIRQKKSKDKEESK